MPASSAPHNPDTSKPAPVISKRESLPAGLMSWQIEALQKLTATAPLLVTDDDLMSRQYYRTLLAQTSGLTLLETWDPDEALRICHRQPISLVISCILKPATTDGFKLVSDLRADPRTRAIPLLFITGTQHTRDLAFEAGADAYLSKPCHPNEILQEIWRLLRSRVL